jgi:hydrogenase expression/formation protein HypD
MRFADEFRDPHMARVLAAQIASLCEPRRHYKFMEVCGGHTHTIYKPGLEDYLPPLSPLCMDQDVQCV